ncbi:MAG: response regulator [Gemmatimonadales bacterium]
MPTYNAQRWARVRFDDHRNYPVIYQGQWFRVVERHDPDAPLEPGYIWLDLAGKAERVSEVHFDIVERAKRRILVVDDDPGIRQTLQIALRNAGFEVLQARDGEEGTRLWQETGPDLIITDIHMPEKSGLLLVQELQASSSSTRVIAMTDGGPARNLNLLSVAQMLGAVRTIAKPFSLEEMVKVVNEELGR